jgi:hypothetical protein
MTLFLKFWGQSSQSSLSLSLPSYKFMSVLWTQNVATENASRFITPTEIPRLGKMIDLSISESKMNVVKGGGLLCLATDTIPCNIVW